MTVKREYKPFYWLNDESRAFLGNGYLLPGVTAEERIYQIAEHAEHILGLEGFAERFVYHMSRGHFSLSTPIWCNFGAGRSLPISCVTGDTWINTIDGGKMAKDIEIGDLVLTHKNRYRPVTKIIPTANKDDIWKLKINTRMTNLYITGNHPVLTNLGWVRVDELDPNLHLIAVNGEQQYDVNDGFIFDMTKYINYPFIISEGVIYPDTSKIKANLVSSITTPHQFVEIDEDLAWAIGLWFAEGSICTNNKMEPNGIKLTLNVRDEELGNRWVSIMEDKFNLSGGVHRAEVERCGKINRWLNVVINGKCIGNLFATFGRGCKNKILPKEFLNLPSNHLEALWEGVMNGDGSVKPNNTRRLTLSNPKLILQMYLIGLRLGKEMSLQMQEKPGKLSTTPHVYTILELNYTNSTRKKRSSSAIKFSDGLVYCPIRTLEKTELVRDVWDFTVEEDHSFSAAGVILHNCFGSVVPDSVAGIMETATEIAMMGKEGGGTSAYFGKVRPRGSTITNNGKSDGSFSFLKIYESVIDVISQGTSRRSQLASYIDIDHGDIEEWLDIQTEGNPIQLSYYGVCVSNEWLEEMKAGDKYKRRIWAKVLQRRNETGVPYIFFKDNANNNKPDVYKDKNLPIVASNMCVEVFLPSSEEESFVCCLMSLNLLHYEEWKDTDAVKVATYFLDAVMSEFIRLAKNIPHLERAVRFAERHRALGIGVLGWHSYLQSNMIPFESFQAMMKNSEIFKHIKEKSWKASKELAKNLGEPEILKGYGRRHTTLTATAPTKSSSFILGAVSPSIEPFKSNYYIKDLAKGKTVFKNPYLVELLQSKGKDTEEVWLSILKQEGSVQHLDFLTQEEKDVFKTFGEINQLTIIQQAAQRQQFIDQGQSLNLTIHPNTPTKDVNQLYLTAAELGIKGLYYQFNTSAAQAFNRSLLTDCVSCSA